MKIDELVINRFEELLGFENEIMQTRPTGGGESKSTEGGFLGRNRTFKTTKFDKVDSELAKEWGLNCRYIIQKTFGFETDHYIEFKRESSFFGSDQNYKHVKLGFSVLRSARDNCSNGLLFDTRTLVEAEVFDDFLEKAAYLADKGYFTASAVIAGSVLEDALRKLCKKKQIVLSDKPKLDIMNAELVKVGAYNVLKQKQITALADLRNKAAHGQVGFTNADVEEMIRSVRRFLADYFS